MSTATIPVAVIRARDGAILVVLPDGRVLRVEPGGEVAELEAPRLPQAQAGEANPTRH